MKRLMMTAALLVMSLLLCANALADTVCAREDVDLSEVVETDGHLTGMLRWTNKSGRVLELQMDCRVPFFTEEQAVNMAFWPRTLSVKELSDALTKAGADVSAGSIDPLYGDAESTEAFWRVEGQVFHSLSKPRSLRSASRIDDPALDGAKAPVLSAMEALGIPVYRDLLHAVSTEDGVVMHGLYEVNGLPVMKEYYYMDGNAKICLSAEYAAAVKDGRLTALGVYSPLEITGKEPANVAELTWQELLIEMTIRGMLANNSISLNGYAVLTDLTPCYMGVDWKLVPAYAVAIEVRSPENGAVLSTWEDWMNAETLESYISPFNP